MEQSLEGRIQYPFCDQTIIGRRGAELYTNHAVHTTMPFILPVKVILNIRIWADIIPGAVPSGLWKYL